jgi:molybdenum cofactor biosynthesis protein B|tara:strand:- start:48 stop:578 length:531 start_codon:yes stop_codon:yes gene_type:complete
MSPIDEKRKFISVNIALLTITDSRTLNEDISGDFLAQRITDLGHYVYDRQIIKDEVPLIKKIILSWVTNPEINIIITTGGTGLTGRDSTPEAIKEIADKTIDGFGELFRQISFNKIGTSTIQSRALGAVIKGTYVFALPGSKNACKDAWDEILKFQLDNRYRPCNFIEIIPRLMEV